MMDMTVSRQAALPRLRLSAPPHPPPGSTPAACPGHQHDARLRDVKALCILGQVLADDGVVGNMQASSRIARLIRQRWPTFTCGSTTERNISERSSTKVLKNSRIP